ncbi:response regulator transcription factor [Pseudomonas sp. DC3200b2]|uniref:response regulator transcription factor n=1 Tax=Pseudomonas sp. DC3200b2 TaxID=2804669 RepID=UPI003CEE393B
MLSVGVVDDDLSVRKSLMNLLKAAGYRPTSFASGEALLASPDIDAFDCIVMDLRMGGLQGTQVQRLLNEGGSSPAVICMSAFWDQPSLDEASTQGAYHCLRKPFTAEELLASIQGAVAGRQPPG